MKVNLRIAIASAAAVALALPTLALGQGPAPKLSESPTSGFPDKAYVLTLPSRQALTTSKLEVTESGHNVTGLAVAPPGGSKSGAMLLIDASNSMKGAPIHGATVAARAFLTERKSDLPAAIIAFNPNVEEVDDLKARYRAGKVGDVEVKTKLASALNAYLAPIRERRAALLAKPDRLREILFEGSKRVRTIAAGTMERVRDAMKISYR